MASTYTTQAAEMRQHAATAARLGRHDTAAEFRRLAGELDARAR